MPRIIRLLIISCLIAAAVELGRYLDWDTLVRYQVELRAWTAAHPVVAAASFVLAYIATAALSMPHGALLTMLGGFLFGAPAGCALTVAGATTGGTILMLIIRNLFGGTLRRHQHRIPQAVRGKLATDGFGYLLAVRFLPVVPFWLVNLAAAAVGLRLIAFVPATLIGIVPICYILSSVGAGIGRILDQGGKPDIMVLFTPQILLPLLGLAAMTILSTVLRRRRTARI